MILKRMAVLAMAMTVSAQVLGCAGGGDDDDDDAGDPQTPPTSGAAAIQAWLADGHYLAWACEGAAHGPLPPSPHGGVRICSNDLMSTHGAGEYPVGASSVKELLSGTSGSPTIVGYAVSLHNEPGTTGAEWYWYEEVDDTILADGVDDPTCVGCHMGAGSDAMHPGHDFVYVQVP